MDPKKDKSSGTTERPNTLNADGSGAAQVQQGCSEHEVYENVLEAYEMYGKKRENYRKYGTLFIIFSAVGFLALMFSLESKISLLILWVITDYICAALMIRAEYRYHEFALLLGYKDTEFEEEDAEQAPAEAGAETTDGNAGAAETEEQKPPQQTGNEAVQKEPEKTAEDTGKKAKTVPKAAGKSDAKGKAADTGKADRQEEGH